MTATATATSTSTANGDDDPYIYLEEVESERSIAFAKMANERCLSQLGDPSHTDTYRRVLAALESDERQVEILYCVVPFSNALHTRMYSLTIVTFVTLLTIPLGVCMMCVCVCRIPHVNLLGYDASSGDMLLYNFWKDSKVIMPMQILFGHTPMQNKCLNTSIVSNVSILFRLCTLFGSESEGTLAQNNVGLVPISYYRMDYSPRS
jgi:hypothetical protein